VDAFLFYDEFDSKSYISISQKIHTHPELTAGESPAKVSKFLLIDSIIVFFYVFNYRYKCSIFCDNLTNINKNKIFITNTTS